MNKLDQMVAHWRTNGAQWAEYALPRLLVILVVAFIFLTLLRAITKRLVEFSKASHVRTGLRAQQLRTLASVILSVGTVLIYFLAAMQALPLFGVDVKPILASAGIAGLAIGFGAQTLVKDVINGFFILLENQYDLGDTVRLAGVTGTVEVMSLRRTVLRDMNGAVHVIPNSEVKVVANMTRDWGQLAIPVTVDYRENSERVIKLLNEVAKGLYADPVFHDQLVSAPEVLGIDRMSGQEVDYLVIVKALPNQQWGASREFRRRVKDTFERNGIRTPDPQRMFLQGAAPAGDESEPS